MEQWRLYSEKFLTITPREQYLIVLTGFIVIIMSLFHLFLDGNLSDISKAKKDIISISNANKNSTNSIELYKEALMVDPNINIRKKIAQHEKKLASIDENLLALTSELINPIQMRYALLELLKFQQGVSLVSFEVSAAQPLLMQQSADESDEGQAKPVENNKAKIAVNVKGDEAPIGLYKHAIKIKLKGKYFQLKNYLTSLENMSFTFFWKQFEYKLTEYPVSELEVTLYSLSTKRDFIGV